MMQKEKLCKYNELVRVIHTKANNDNKISLEEITKIFNDLRLENIFNKTNLCKNVELDETKQTDLNFYMNSLKEADREVNSRKIALKDRIGKAYENHRKRIWEYYGFSVDKKTNGATFNVDWSIYKDGKLIAFEECKGHYVDKDFLKRAVFDKINTIYQLVEDKKPIPLLILSSYTKYGSYNDSISQMLRVFHENLVKEFKEKSRYTYLNDTSSRISRKKWFKKDVIINAYFDNLNETKYILEDIDFIKSLNK